MEQPQVPKQQPVDRDDLSRAAMPVRPQPIGIVDQWGIMWWVSERDARDDPGCPAERCLIFANERAVRRVWIYPRDWERFSDSELDALSCSHVRFPLPRGGTA